MTTSNPQQQQQTNTGGAEAEAPVKSATYLMSKPTARNKVKKVFSSPASYHRITWALLSIAPLCILLGAVIVWKDEHAHYEKKERGIITLWIALILTIMTFLFILPSKFEVNSDASITVFTLPHLSWKFDHATAAYEDPSFAEGFRPRIKFATDLKRRVLVRRKHGGWDVLVSPKDPQGFVQAVWNVARQVEAQEADAAAAAAEEQQ